MAKSPDGVEIALNIFGAMVMVFMIVMLGIALFSMGKHTGKAEEHKAAVDAGVGEYYFPDSSVNETKFRYKVPKEVEHVP